MHSAGPFARTILQQSRSQSLRYPCPAERETRESLLFPVPLDKGNEDSGNEIDSPTESFF